MVSLTEVLEQFDTWDQENLFAAAHRFGHVSTQNALSSEHMEPESGVFVALGLNRVE
jgi:hypothetical protein